MPPRVPWMTDVDRVILEFATKRRGGTSTADIYVNWPEDQARRRTSRHINRRMRKLAENGFLKKQGEKHGWYTLGPKGKKFLNDPNATVDDFMPDETAETAEDEDDDE